MNFSRSLLLFAFLRLACPAQTIHGNVMNGSTGKPESGQEVILFTTQGEQARTITNDNGNFQIEPKAKLNPHSTAVLQVIHGGVEYFQAVSPGKDSNVRVYEASSQSSAISDYLSILQFEVKGTMLEVMELHAFNNTSNPPITRVSPENLVISLPDGAQVQAAIVAGPDGGTVRLPLVSTPGQKGRYRIDFPLKPGLTKYAISYAVPHEGRSVFRRQAQYPTRKIGVIAPDSMHFRSLGANVFHAVEDQPGTQEQVLEGVGAHEPFAFELSGAGGLARSLRSLNPGEPTRLAQVQTEVQALMSTPWPRGGSAETHANPTQGRAIIVRQQLMLGLGILVLTGILVWGVRLKRTPRM